MKTILLYDQSNNFTEILKDNYITKNARAMLVWNEHLWLELADEKVEAYLMLKYGDLVKPVSSIIDDRSPVVNVDYVPTIKRPHNELSSSSKSYHSR